ncbi:MAG: DNA-directed RNA polymerase subunit beta', partial [Bacilli bacterium]
FQSSQINPEWMILTSLPVIPPDLRPMMQLDGGRYATSDLNDLYRQVIIKNNRLKKEIEAHAPNVILINEKRMLQEAIDALIDNERRNKPATSINGNVLRSLSSTLKGKQGRFRQNLLGKRVDYSGRSVIAVGPELNMDECGLPREMAIQLFRPFISNYLMNVQKVVNSQRQADELIANGDPRVYDAIEVVSKDHPVLLNRAPTLHRLGIQAFKPILIEGKAIRLHPLVCPGFNADFDGDQMAVHVPLSKQAQAEAMTLMLANHNILKPSDGKPICVPSQDMIFGNYYLTLEDDEQINRDYMHYYSKANEEEMVQKFESYISYEGKVFTDPDTAILAYHNGILSLRTRIYVPAKSLNKTCFSEEQNSKYLLTTVGKLIFNAIFPDDFPYVNFPSKASKNAKADLAKNFSVTLDEFFVTAKQCYDAVIASGKFHDGDDFDAFKEYCHLQPLRSPIDKKGIQSMMDYVFRDYGATETAKIMDAFKNQGFDYCTKSGLTISLGDIKPLDGRAELYENAKTAVANITEQYELGFFTDEERHDAIISYWNRLKDKDMKGLLNERMASASRNPMFMMMESGARGSTDNYMQLIGMKGCMLDSTGRAIEVPVTDCYADGLTVSEYFTSTHGTRKNGSDTALKTADSGYLTRRLVDVSHNVVIREVDCHCDHGIVVKELKADDGQIISNLYDRLVGRFTMHDVINPESGEIIAEKNTFMDEDVAHKIVDAGITAVEIRSILTCESIDGACIRCYGRNLATGQITEIGDTVGIMAAQSIGEPGTQLTLKNFHTGGVSGQKDITTGLPRVQELLEVRNPKLKDAALISLIRGTVTEIKEAGLRHVFTVSNELESKEFTSYPNSVPNVKTGDVIPSGYPLTKGHINPKDLLACTDLATVRNYLIKEVKGVYSSNGIAIADKHLEIIVRQMTNKLTIINSGDTEMLPGQRFTDVDFTERNTKSISHGGNPAVGRPLVMGITKSALDTDSFLSAASFQETTKVLTDAAIKGKVDSLRGLKENVMIGKLIPAGTGLKPILDDSDLEDDEEAQLDPIDNDAPVSSEASVSEGNSQF